MGYMSELAICMLVAMAGIGITQILKKYIGINVMLLNFLIVFVLEILIDVVLSINNLVVINVWTILSEILVSLFIAFLSQSFYDKIKSTKEESIKQFNENKERKQIKFSKIIVGCVLIFVAIITLILLYVIFKIPDLSAQVCGLLQTIYLAIIGVATAELGMLWGKTINEIKVGIKDNQDTNETM